MARNSSKMAEVIGKFRCSIVAIISKKARYFVGQLLFYVKLFVSVCLIHKITITNFGTYDIFLFNTFINAQLINKIIDKVHVSVQGPDYRSTYNFCVK